LRVLLSLRGNQPIEKGAAEDPGSGGLNFSDKISFARRPGQMTKFSERETIFREARNRPEMVGE
jgi:uncharacterized protein YjiS (DUF1127 family)